LHCSIFYNPATAGYNNKKAKKRLWKQEGYTNTWTNDKQDTRTGIQLEVDSKAFSTRS